MMELIRYVEYRYLKDEYGQGILEYSLILSFMIIIFIYLFHENPNYGPGHYFLSIQALYAKIAKTIGTWNFH